MSYALETKKRKFDRILETLTDGSSAQSRTSLNSRNNQTSNSTESLLDASKRRRVTPILNKSDSRSSLGGHYLPSSRTAFLDRLETFRHVTKWHIPSTGLVNAVAWAKRGWICVDTDTVSCGSCKERVTVDLENSTTGNGNKEKEYEEDLVGDNVQKDVEDNDEMSTMIYEGLIKRYAEMIVTSHGESCPWRKRGCDSSIQRIEGLLNSITAVTSMRDRVIGIAEMTNDIPTVMAFPNVENVNVNDDGMMSFKLHTDQSTSVNTLKLAMSGWQKKDDDIVECKHCFRSLGLWLYRGSSPSVENLDVIESHLDYCPWRSPEAQDTAIVLPSSRAKEKEEKTLLPGWVLMYLAMVKQNSRGQGHVRRQSLQASTTNTDRVSVEEVSPEQREKKMKDLMRRIREIKKPFNVKSLLRKKDKSAS